MTPARNPKQLTVKRSSLDSMSRHHGGDTPERKSCRSNHGRGNHGGVIMEEKSLWRTHGGASMDEQSWRSNREAAIMEEQTGRRNYGGEMMEENSCRRSRGEDLEAEAPRRHPGCLQEASMRHPGGPREVPRRLRGGTEGTQRHPGGSQGTRGVCDAKCPETIMFYI